MMTASKAMTLSVVTMTLLGCVSRMTIEEWQAMKAERPAELDKLNDFVGRWNWEGEGKIAGLEQPVRFTGRRESQWEGDGWYLVTREVGNMEGFGESRTLTIWSYDMHAGLFRTAYVDSVGTTTTGTARYDPETDSWHCRATSHGPGGTSSASGHVRFPDPNTMEWDWTEYDTAGLRKTMVLRGVCRREN